MSETIKDGTGTGDVAKVSDGRLFVQALTFPHELNATMRGDAYIINTGLISITATATLMYIKNNAVTDMIIEAGELGSLGGATHNTKPYVRVVKNITGGNLITDATAIPMDENRNFGSSKILDIDAFKGKVGGTITGGADIGFFQANTAARSFFPMNLVLPRGASIAIELITDIGATSENWYCAVYCHNVSAI